MAYPTSKPETLADGAVHLAGLLFAIPAATLLLFSAPQTSTIWTATALYAATLVFALIASAVYHMTPYDQWRAILGRIDHACIYFKIAGSYTPVVVVISSDFAYSILGLVWGLAIFGAVAKLSFWRIDARGSLPLYIGMGWISVLLVWEMWHKLPSTAFALIVTAGAIYSLGTYVYAHPGMRFQNAIWHVFVLSASICLYNAIALTVQSAGA